MEEQGLKETLNHQERKHTCLKSLGGTKDYHANGTRTYGRNEDDISGNLPHCSQWQLTRD